LVIGGLVVVIDQRFFRVEIFGDDIDFLLSFSQKREKK